MRDLTAGNQRFANTMHRRSVAGGIVVALADADARAFYFGTATMIYPSLIDYPDLVLKFDGIISDVSPVRTSLDVTSMTTEVANCTLTLSALPREKTHDSAAKWRSVVDDLWKVEGQGSSVWLLPGGPLPKEDFGSLLDLFQYVALNVGYFRVARVNMDDPANVVVELTEWDVSTLRRTVFLPQNKFTRALFPAIDETRIGVTMPLVWGGDDIDSALALIGSYNPIERISNDTWLICDHEEFVCGPDGTPGGQFVVYIESLDACAAAIYNSSHIEYINSGGRAYVHVTDMYNLQFRVSIPPTRSYLGSTVTDPDSTFAWDGDLETGASVIAQANNLATICFEWGQGGVPEDSAAANSIGEIIVDAGTPKVCRVAKLWLNAAALLTSVTSSTLEVWDIASGWVPFKTNPIPAGSVATVDSAFPLDGGTTPPAWNWCGVGDPKGIFWHLGTGQNGADADGQPFKCRLVLNNSSNNWVVGATIARVYETRLQVDAKAIMQKYQGVHKASRRGTYRWGQYGESHEQFPEWMSSNLNRSRMERDFGDDDIGFRPKGRMFGSWCTGRYEYGQTALTAGQPIYQPQYIIESILRDELGYGDSQIDMASFDAALPHGAHAVWLPAGTKIGAKDLLDQICYETGLILLYSSGGKWKLLDYTKATTGGAQFTVFPDDLADMVPILSQTSTDQIRNDVTVSYCPSALRGSSQRKKTYADAASSGKFGLVQDDFELTTIQNDTSDVDKFGHRLIGSNGILSRPHGGILLHTIGWKFAHVEVGDRGALDASMDYYRMYFGRSWGGRTFLVVDVAVGLDQVDITLYDKLELWTP